MFWLSFEFFHVLMKMPEESKDCLSCRLTSGGGLIFGGVYVIYQSKKVKKYPQAVASIGYALGMLGILRILALPPFRKSNKQVEEKPDNTGQNDYIVGKYSTKFH